MLQKEMAAALPPMPGVYFFHDAQHRLLYIGKAKSLRKRVLSYTYATRHPRRIRRLIQRTAYVAYQICGSELEALILESRLIKERQPPFNRVQKRFRRFRFIKIEADSPYPRVSVVTEIAADDARYFGPFPNALSAERALSVLHKLFPLRLCEGPIYPREDARPCFEYHLGRCLAPCAARVSPQTYRDLLDDVARFLRGENKGYLERLIARRDEAARQLLFEKAAYLQRQIIQVQAVLERHRFCVNDVEHNDVAVVGRPGPDGQTVMFIRGGQLVAHERLDGDQEGRQERIAKRVRQIYAEMPPPKLYTPYDVDAMNIICNWLYHRRGEQGIVRFDTDLERFAQAILHIAAQLRGGFIPRCGF